MGENWEKEIHSFIRSLMKMIYVTEFLTQSEQRDRSLGSFELSVGQGLLKSEGQPQSRIQASLREGTQVG